MDGWFEVDQRINYATAAVERWRKDNPEPEPGTVLMVVDTRDQDPDD